MADADRLAVMAMFRVLVAFVVGALCAVFAVPAAVAKEGVRARLDTALPVAAPPGTTITIGWTLSYSNYGTHRPFDAYGLFVRLVSASGGTSTRAPGEGSAGRYVARVVVPAGGIARIEFGLDGWKSLADGSSAEADAYFPLENDPFRIRAGTRRASTAARTTNTGWPAPIWVAAAGLVYAIGVGISVSRRLARHRAGTGHQDQRGAY